jgi:D-beta-D-heptose 7-phosphate kinase/D-beta-D-heptose 1-phosphate adenosyltransferase
MNKQIVVLTNGVFDILHRGHLQLLKIAKSMGDFLIVAIDAPERVSRIKPGRPINDLQTRIEMLEAIKWVDKVIVFDSEMTEVVKRIKPDVLVKGGDYKVKDVIGGEIVESYGGKVVIVPAVPGCSTSNFIKSIQKKCPKKSWL